MESVNKQNITLEPRTHPGAKVSWFEEAENSRAMELKTPKYLIVRMTEEGKSFNNTQLVADLDLPCDSHDVVTSDGYILNIFRVPRPGSIPVVFMPGFLSSSSTFAIAPKNQSIVTLLAENGYDLWLLNYRGSYFGKRHMWLDPKKNAARFWDFTFQEIATRDIPAILDYVENETGFKEVLYIGHSMGCLSLYVMCIERPDYCNRVRAAGLLAPVIFPPDSRDKARIAPALKLIKRFAATARSMGKYELFGDEEDRAKSMQRTCAIPIIGKTLCTLSVTLPFSRSTHNVDQATLPSYMVNTLSGTSIKLAEHMIQLMTSKNKVPRFDYGRRKNRVKYKNSLPFYNGTISVPLVVFHSKSDPFTDVKAINRLSKVANIVYDKFIEDLTFNHINFLFSNDAPRYIFNDLLTLLKSVTDM